jgi:gas vesicle protein
MRRHQKAGIGKVAAGLLVGSIVGATVGWLTSPSSVEEIRRRLRGGRMGAEEKAKTTKGNLESKFRYMADVSSDPLAEAKVYSGI